MAMPRPSLPILRVLLFPKIKTPLRARCPRFCGTLPLGRKRVTPLIQMVEIDSQASLAPAKINLTLRISGRRADGFHELESLVAFAPFGDRLTFSPGGPLDLDVSGPMAD